MLLEPTIIEAAFYAMIIGLQEGTSENLRTAFEVAELCHFK